jgi:hypothetical protein
MPKTKTAKRRADYLIYRHGSNAFNQSMTQTEAVAIVNGAPGETEARRFAGESIPVASCYSNQHLEAVPVSRAKKADVAAVCENDGLNHAHGCSPVVVDYKAGA